MNREYLGIELVQTCGGCPESYNAFFQGEKVAYLRLRHGCFTVDYPDYCEENLWTCYPDGDGGFTTYERDYYLETACYLIKERIGK